MTQSRRVHGLAGLQQAFDEVRFGAARTLNLRESLPTGTEAARRVDAWLREHQARRSGELLVIKGRGNNSESGIAVVREATLRVFHDLRRKGVVQEFAEHTPGSFVVTLAPMQAMLDARRPKGSVSGPTVPAPSTPPMLSALDASTREQLRVLAERSLDALGVRGREAFVEHEMLRLFGELARSAGEGADREARLRAAIARMLADVD
jgi:hypothetical protein